MSRLWFLGDVHAKFDKMGPLIRKIKAPIIQVGDFGFGFAPLPEQPNNLRVVCGNHDNREDIYRWGNVYRTWDYDFVAGKLVFVIPGGYSVDRDRRTIGVDLWEDEEMSLPAMQRCLNYYRKVKPKLLVSHEPPTWIKENLGFKGSRTSDLIQACLETSSPELHVFGHLHKSFQWERNGCVFKSLGELELWHP